MGNIRSYVNTVLVISFIALLLYGLHDFTDFNEIMSRKRKIETNWFLDNFQFYTFVAAITTLFHGLGYIFNLIIYRLRCTSNKEFRVSKLLDSITLSMNSLVALIFWPTYILNKELLLGKTLCKNPKYFFDMIMHLCPLFISILIVLRRPDFSRETRPTRFFIRTILLFIIDSSYLAILLYSNKVYGRYPYPMLNKLSISQIYASIAFVFIIEVCFMALLQYPIQKIRSDKGGSDRVYETPITGNIK